MRERVKPRVVSGWTLAALGAGWLGCGSPPPAVPAPGAAGEARKAVSGAPAFAGPLDDDPAEPASPAGPRSEVTVKILVDARRKAHVWWGRKDLGLAPLELKRPRGSGPLDLVLVADGCLPEHTRVFTDRDDTLAVRLYSADEAAGLLGHPVGRPIGQPR